MENNREILDLPISALEIKLRTLNLLKSFGIETIGELIQNKESDLGAHDGMGLLQVRKIQEALSVFGLSLAEEPPKGVKTSHYNKIQSDKYRQKIRRFTLQFNLKDAEAREWFERQLDPGAYLKGLILKDKAERNKGISEGMDKTYFDSSAKLGERYGIEAESSICCISVETLFEQYGENLKFHYISRSEEDGEMYFDIVDNFNTILCMDGEECTIISRNSDFVLLENDNNAEFKMQFKLSVDEFNVASFGKQIGIEVKDSLEKKIAGAIEKQRDVVKKEDKQKGIGLSL